MLFIRNLVLALSVVWLSANLSASPYSEEGGLTPGAASGINRTGDNSDQLSVKLMLRSGNGWSVDRELGIWREGENATSSLCPIWAHSNCGEETILLDGEGMDRIDESQLSLQCMWLLNDVQNGSMIMGQCGGEEIIIKAFLIN
jgi:hypothetical protein